MICFVPFISIAQGWEKSYDDYTGTISTSSDKTLDGNIIIATKQNDTITDLQTLVLFETDSIGNVVAEYLYPTLTDSLVRIHEIHSTLDSNYLVSFTSGPSPDDPSLVVKVSPNGDILWQTAFPYEDIWDVRYIEENSDGEYILVGKTDNTPFGDGTGICKLDNNGNIIWVTSFVPFVNGNDLLSTPQSLIISATNDIRILIRVGNFSLGGLKPTVIKLNNNGDLIWEKTYNNYTASEAASSIIELGSGDFMILTSKISPALIKIDEDGNQLWHKSYPQNETITSFYSSLVETNDDGIAIGGVIDYPFNNPSDFYLMKVDSVGNFLWKKTYGRSNYEWKNKLFLADDQGFYITGISWNLNNKSHPYIVKTDSQGNLYSNSLEGTLFNDENFDCIYETNEDQLSQWLIQAIKGENHYSSITSEFGEYNFSLDTGTYHIEVSPLSPYWELCDTTFEITYTTFLDTILQDVPAQVGYDCPLLDVSMGTPFLRRCSTSIYSVQYCNNGTATAVDAYIEITLDPDMALNSSSIPTSSIVGDVLTFDLGDIAYDTCGTFNFEIFLGDSTNCDSILLGATHCVEAHIYPDSICLPGGMWLGGSIEVDANCSGDSIIFYIQNVGTAATQPNLQYIVVEDDVILFDGYFSLNPNEVETITILANGSTFRLEAEQEPNHPGMSMPSVSVENCGLPNSTFSFGFVNIFSMDDGDPFVDIDCRDNIGSFDPNDKQGYPLGYSDENYIDRGQDLEYMIRFQNTGTDTAFLVVIKDQLSEFLDIASVRPGASSHAYEYSVSGNGLMSFTFNNIMLPDSNVNEPASNGFIKFKVSQKYNLDLETQIHNEATIYFDFNAPVITNETLHTIGEDFVIVSIENPLKKSLAQVKAHPNPFTQFVTFDVEGLEVKNGTFKLYDAMGRLLRLQNINNNTFTFQKKGLQAGVYFFTIEENGQLISNGKLIAQ